MEFTTRKAVILSQGFEEITKEFLGLLKEQKLKKYDKFKQWVEDCSYIGVYIKGSEIFINSPTGNGMKYIEKSVRDLTGFELIQCYQAFEDGSDSYHNYRNLNQYTQGGEEIKKLYI